MYIYIYIYIRYIYTYTNEIGKNQTTMHPHNLSHLMLRTCISRGVRHTSQRSATSPSSLSFSSNFFNLPLWTPRFTTKPFPPKPFAITLKHSHTRPLLFLFRYADFYRYVCYCYHQHQRRDDRSDTKKRNCSFFLNDQKLAVNITTILSFADSFGWLLLLL